MKDTFISPNKSTPCNTLQHSATCRNTLYRGHLHLSPQLQHSATLCNTLQHAATHYIEDIYISPHSYLHYNIVQHSATHFREVHDFFGVATISRLLKIIRLFCRRALWKRLYCAKETYHFKEPTNHSHPILSWFPDAYLSIWPLTQILLRTLPKTAIFDDFKCIAEAISSTLIMLLLENGFISSRTGACSEY